MQNLETNDMDASCWQVVRILKDGNQRKAIAKVALERLMTSLALHFQVLAETENNPAYIEKITQIRSILFDSEESR